MILHKTLIINGVHSGHYYSEREGSGDGAGASNIPKILRLNLHDVPEVDDDNVHLSQSLSREPSLLSNTPETGPLCPITLRAVPLPTGIQRKQDSP